MPINSSDVRFKASQRMTDFDNGGGQMSTVAIVSGQDNNLFDDLTDVQRLQGQLSLRKVYAAALNADGQAYLSAHVLLADLPDDPATEAFLMLGASNAEERAAVAARLPWNAGWLSSGASHTATAAPDLLTLTITTGGTPAAGTLLYVTPPFGASVAPVLRSAESVASNTVVLDEALPAAWGSGGFGIQSVTGYVTGIGQSPSGLTERVWGAAHLVAAASTADLVLDRRGVATRPLETPGADYAAGSTLRGATFNRVPVFAANDLVLVHHTASTAPTAATNGSTINTGRTNLARLVVVGSNGVEHARFDLGQPAPSGVGCTANLAAGTVTFSDVSGMSNPVTVRHRIEEMAVVKSAPVLGRKIKLRQALSRTYPIGSVVSSLLMVGDLQGRVATVFAQQAWTGVWDDARIGGEPTADYNSAAHPITTTNAGAVTERWAILFTGPTSFRLVGETLGEVATGSTTADFAPNNPATGAPYLTVPQAGWGNAWNNGNVLRVNTGGAAASAWVGRNVNPSVPVASDAVTLELRGYTNN